jgi:hypothetical protein
VRASLPLTSTLNTALISAGNDVLSGALSAVLPSSDLGGPHATLLTQANFLATGATTMVQCE